MKHIFIDLGDLTLTNKVLEKTRILLYIKIYNKVSNINLIAFVSITKISANKKNEAVINDYIGYT